MAQDDMKQTGLDALNWLVRLQTDSQGHFVPVGCNGWYVQGQDKARFSQQPIEAMNMIEACCDAFQVTSEKPGLTTAHLCLEWFLGCNDLNAPLYDYRTGGCCDGLEALGPNQNQGAESTLAWLLALARLYQQRQPQVVGNEEFFK